MTPPSKNRAVRTMIHLLAMGKEGIINAFRKHFTLADYFRELMKEDERFEILETINKFPLVMFRLKGLTNDQNNDYLTLVMEKNKIFIVSSVVHEVMFLRMNIGTFTHEERHIKEAFIHFQETATKYLAEIE